MTLNVSRAKLAIGGFLLLALLAGCVSTTFEVTVDSDGQIEEANIDLAFQDQATFSSVQQQANAEGYDTVGEWLAEDVRNGSWDSVSSETNQDALTVNITATGGDPAGMENISVTVDEEAGEITYVDMSGLNQTQGFQGGGGGGGGFGGQQSFETTYIVNMPGEIIDTNGETLDDGTSVQWNTNMSGNFDQLEVTSERGGGGGDGGIADGLGPGFGVGAALAGLLVVGGALVAARRRQ